MLVRTLTQILFVLCRIPVDKQASRVRAFHILIDNDEYIPDANVTVQNVRFGPRITVTYAARQRFCAVDTTKTANLPEHLKLQKSGARRRHRYPHAVRVPDWPNESDSARLAG